MQLNNFSLENYLFSESFPPHITQSVSSMVIYIYCFINYKNIIENVQKKSKYY